MSICASTVLSIKVLTVYTYISIRIRYTPSTSNNWCSRCPFLLWRLRCWTSRPLDLEPVKHRHLITWSTNGAHVDMCSSSSSLPLYVSRKENEENAFLTELLTYVWHILLFICTSSQYFGAKSFSRSSKCMCVLSEYLFYRNFDL